MTAISTATLKDISIATPTYDRSKVRPGIVHIGVGAFHRAHQARFADAVLSLEGEDSVEQWGICGVALMQFDAKIRDVMKAQDNMYTLWARGPSGDDARVVGSHCEFLFAPEEHEIVVQRLTSPDTKVVTLTVTEKGYCSKLSDGSLDSQLPAVQADLATLAAGGTALQTSLGFLTAAAQRRRAENAPKLGVLSCDNVQENGHRLERCILAFAELAGGAELRTYMEENWTFPNSMVDRITPATTDSNREAVEKELGVKDQWPIVSEDFIQWVVEDRFPAGRPPWEKVLNGACLMVDDVLPYELMKLRLLNGGHQSVGFAGIVAGHRDVDQAMSDPAVHSFVARYMDAVGESLPPVPGVDFAVYKEQLRMRFSNKVVKDQLLRLAEDGRNRIEVACIPCLQKMQAANYKPVAALVACWIRYLASDTDDAGQSFVRPPDSSRPVLEPLAVALWATAQGGAAPGQAEVEGFLQAAFPPCSAELLATVPLVGECLATMAKNGANGLLLEVGK